jgi:hypothetical protein
MLRKKKSYNFGNTSSPLHNVSTKVKRCFVVPSTLPTHCIASGGGGPTPSYLHRPGHWSPLPPFAALAAGWRGTSFLCSIVRAKPFMLGCVVSRWMFRSHLHFHIDNDLHGSVSELMVTCPCWSFRSSEICFSMCRWRSLLPTAALETMARWML